MRRTRPAAALLLAARFVACGRDATYTGIGDVLAIDADRRHATIRHEDIPGLMGAMTMRFAVASSPVLAGIEPGAHVRFVIRPQDDTFVIVNMTVLAPSGAAQ